MLLILLAVPTNTPPAEAQGVGWGSVGLVGGTVVGGWSTLGAIVARSRLGTYTFDTDDIPIVSLETLPILAFPIAGAWLGSTSSDRLVSAAEGSGLGFVGGGLVGLGLGALISEDTEGRWAGAIIGSAAGLMVGAVIGGLQKQGSEDGPPGSNQGAVPIVLSLQIGGPG